MRPLPTDPFTVHQQFMQAFCEDILARDYHAPRAKIVSEISRQLSTEREARAAEKAAGHKS